MADSVSHNVIVMKRGIYILCADPNIAAGVSSSFILSGDLKAVQPKHLPQAIANLLGEVESNAV